MTTARSWWCGDPSEGAGIGVAPMRRHGAAALLILLLLTACVPEIPEPVVTATTSPEVAAIEAARDSLADPVPALAAAALDVARRTDFIRHEVARGPAMRQAVADLDALLPGLEAQAQAVQVLVVDMDGVLAPARDAVEDLAAESRRVGEVAAADVRYLQPLLDVDDAMAAVVAGWDDRGSRSEAPQRLADLLGTAEEVRAQVRRLSIPPAACQGLRSNRLRWADTLVSRTQQLHELAVAADGIAYDALRARFDTAPYGEDRAAADAESRACWADQTGMLDVDGLIGDAVRALEVALAG